MRLLLFLLLICSGVFAIMTQEESLVYMLQLAHDCVQARIDYVACRNRALRSKSELWGNHAFMGQEFHEYYIWTSKIATPEQVAAIHERYAQQISGT